MFRNNKSGFTLVELAIVMMIIGLLIGGVLKGQEMVENARVDALIKQTQSYQAAVVSFMDMYSAIPGDMVTATTRVPNCTAATFCRNGDGNSLIGYTGGTVNNLANVMGDNENTQFWKQLALADLISGVNSGANPITPAWGETNPASKYQGGFVVFFLNQTASWTGHWYRMQSQTFGQQNEQQGTYPISPFRMSQIDRKLDDGIPQTGYVRSVDAGPGYASGCEGPVYDESIKQGNCLPYFNVGISQK